MFKSILEIGPTRLLEIIESEVDWSFGNWDEDQGIGSSDVSCCVRSVIREAGMDFDSLPEVEIGMIRTAVQNKISDLFA